MRKRTVGTDEDFEIVAAFMGSLPVDERQLYYDEYDFFDVLSGEACPTIANIEKYDARIEEAMER